jgi:S1-C subfamily serine protease
MVNITVDLRWLIIYIRKEEILLQNQLKKYKNYIIIGLLSFLLGAVIFVNGSSGIVTALNSITVSSSAEASSAGNSTVADIVQNVGPAIVYIEASVSAGNQNRFGFYEWYYQQQQEESSTGTGFIINSNGYILTNEHVIDGADKIQVTLQGSSKALDAKVIKTDTDLDLAVLKIDGTNYPTIALGDSNDMRPGDWVIAIGNPYGLDHSVTTGIISAKGRPMTIENRDYTNLIQTDAAINPGNSGGPLINMQGQVIAINTAINADAEGIGFAIPINNARSIIKNIL